MVLWGLIVECDKDQLEIFKKTFKKSTLGYRDAIVKELELMFANHPNHWQVNKNVQVMRLKDIPGYGEIQVTTKEHNERESFYRNQMSKLNMIATHYADHVVKRSLIMH